MTADDVRDVLLKRLAGRTHDALAAELGVTQGYLSKVLAGDCTTRAISCCDSLA